MQTVRHKITIFFFVLYGRGSLSLCQREGNGFRMFENRVRKEVTEGWRNLRSVALGNVIEGDEGNRL
jgi:hypothetical protein